MHSSIAVTGPPEPENKPTGTDDLPSRTSVFQNAIAKIKPRLVAPYAKIGSHCLKRFHTRSPRRRTYRCDCGRVSDDESDEEEEDEEVRIGMKWWDGRNVRCGEERQFRGVSFECGPGPDFSLSTGESTLSCTAMIAWQV